MKKISGKLLIIVGLIMAMGMVSTALGAANGSDDPPKRPKNTGVLSVKTTPIAYPVLVDGVQVGMSGVAASAEFYLTPGTHKVEIQVPNSRPYAKDIDIVKDKKNCICIKIVENTITTPCPYRAVVTGPDSVKEGDLITFFAQNQLNSPNPVSYVWTVFPAGAHVTSGQGTPSITVDSTGFPAQDIRAEVDVSDGSNDAICSQKLPVKTFVEKPKDIIIERPPKEPRFFSSLVFRTFDQDKANLDAYAIELQNNPDAQAYVIVYQGRDKKPASADKMAKRSLDYLVKARGIDPRRIMVTNGGGRPQTTADLFVVSPGAQPPVPTPR